MNSNRWVLFAALSALGVISSAADARFISTDPQPVDTKTGANFNRYDYAADNPYKYVDPDGRVIQIQGDDKFKKAIQQDIKKISDGGNGGKALVEKLEATKNIILIKQDVKQDGNSTQASGVSLNGGKGTGSTVTFDPNKTTGGRDTTGSTTRPAFVGLAHEFGHARAIDLGEQSYDMGSGKPGTTPPSELHSMANENMVRQENGIPLRESYYDNAVSH